MLALTCRNLPLWQEHVKKMAILNAAFYLNHSRVFGWQILKSVVPTGAYSTIFHNAVLPSVVDDVVNIIIITACPHQK